MLRSSHSLSVAKIIISVLVINCIAIKMPPFICCNVLPIWVRQGGLKQVVSGVFSGHYGIAFGNGAMQIWYLIINPLPLQKEDAQNALIRNNMNLESAIGKFCPAICL